MSIDPKNEGGSSGTSPSSEPELFAPLPARGPDAPDFKPMARRSNAGLWIAVIGGLTVALAIAAPIGARLLNGSFAPKKRTVAAAPAAPAAPKPVKAPDAVAKAPAVPAPAVPAQRLKDAFAPKKPKALATTPAAPEPKAESSAVAVGPPTGASITLGCSIPEVGSEVVASCEWARDGGVTFENLRWEGEVLMGTLVVTLVDGRVYASNDMAVIIQPKTPTLLAAR